MDRLPDWDFRLEKTCAAWTLVTVDVTVDVTVEVLPLWLPLRCYLCDYRWDATFVITAEVLPLRLPWRCYRGGEAVVVLCYSCAWRRRPRTEETGRSSPRDVAPTGLSPSTYLFAFGLSLSTWDNFVQKVCYDSVPEWQDRAVNPKDLYRGLLPNDPSKEMLFA